MPALREAHEAIGNQNSRIIAVNLTNNDTLEDVKALLTANGIAFPVLLDTDGAVGRTYGIRSIPTAVVIDRNGVVTDHHIGAYDAQQLLKLLKDGQ